MTENNAAQAVQESERNAAVEEYFGHRAWIKPIASNFRLFEAGFDRAYALLSKLRAEGVQAGDEREAEHIETLQRMRADYNPSDGPMSELKATALDAAIAALASAPVADHGFKAAFPNGVLTSARFHELWERAGKTRNGNYTLLENLTWQVGQFGNLVAQAVGDPVAYEQPIKLSDDVLHFLKEGVENATQCEEADVDQEFADQLLLLMHTLLYTEPLPKQREVDWGPLVVAPVAGEASVVWKHTHRVSGVIDLSMEDLEGNAFNREKWESVPHYSAPQGGAPVAGEVVAWRVTHPRCPQPGWRDAAREPAPSLKEVKQQDADLALELAYAAPQASEAVRNAANKSARAITFDDWLARHCDSDDLTAYERKLALDAWNAARSAPQASAESIDLAGIDADRLRAIAASGSHTAMSNALLNVARALKAQADKDGGDCAKGAGDE